MQQPLPMHQAFAKYIDHTILRPTASLAAITQCCEEALKYGFRTVCVNGCHVELSHRLLDGSSVSVAAVVGFPLGAGTTTSKVFEAEACIGAGAKELDVVVNLGWIKSREFDWVQRELESIRNLNADTVLKLILETCFLEDEEKRTACTLAKESGWDFVKTSTGFGPGGASLADVKLMREVAGSQMQVKASGGVRDLGFALDLIAAGADRLGSSSGVTLIQSFNALKK